MTSSARPVPGVADPRRLDEVSRLALRGQLGDAALDAAAETVADALAVPMAAVNVVTPGLQTYAAEVGIGVPCTTVPDDLSFCAEVVDTGLPLVVPDAAAHRRYRANPLVQDGSIGAYAGFPLVHRGVVLGSVCAFSPDPRDFTSTELRILAAQARLASAVLALRYAAGHDSLTGLANRARGAQFAAEALRSPPASVLFVDIDDFKAVNDAHGHDGGDEALRVLARRLELVLAGTPHLPVRWGGDEFLVVMPGAGRSSATSTAGALAEAAGRGPGRTALGLTVGVATADEVCDLDELVRRASAALAAGKRAGKGRVHVDLDGAPAPSVRRSTRT